MAEYNDLRIMQANMNGNLNTELKYNEKKLIPYNEAETMVKECRLRLENNKD